MPSSKPSIKEIVLFTKTLHILYVEDNLEARESTLGLLENIFHTITLAKDGQEGLEIFKATPHAFDMVISDINMPYMNGLEMSYAIKQLNPKVKITLLSAYDEEEYAIVEEGKIDARFFKPLNLNHFLETLNQIYKICYDSNK